MSGFKREKKYLVFKLEDIKACIEPDFDQRLNLLTICEAVQNYRKSQGKKNNAYVVVNEDDPYAEQVWSLIERHATGNPQASAEKIAACKEMGIDVDKFSCVVDEHDDPFTAVVVTLREYLESEGKTAMEEHKKRHIELHKALDELMGDWIMHTGCLPSRCSVMELATWSARQQENPSEVQK